MSSNRRVLASRANGARSRGPVTPEGKKRSSINAIRHGLLANCIVLECEDPENFRALLQQHIDRLQPADEMEFGMIEEMVSAYWRMRRGWAIETRTIDKAMASQTTGDALDRLVAATSGSTAGDANPLLLHRYETRLHMMYQRALHNLLLLRSAGIPNEPNPISEHDPEPERIESGPAPVIASVAGSPSEPRIPKPESPAPQSGSSPAPGPWPPAPAAKRPDV